MTPELPPSDDHPEIDEPRPEPRQVAPPVEYEALEELGQVEPEPAPAPAEAIPALRGSGVPPVTLVMVSRDPGPWFEEALEGVAQQDYSNLRIVVIDDGSRVPIEDRVIDVLPEADIHVSDSLGFGGAANEIATIDTKAAFYLFVHDDVALEPGSIQAMVGEAFRGNAGIVGAKLLDWDDPTRLLEMGHSADKFGFKWPVSERGELDQGQYDSVNEVFMASTAVLLVRRDLFGDIGGFSEDIDASGQGLDFCWRAQITGGRTLITPGAAARHRERSVLSDPIGGSELVSTRNQTRIVLATYELKHLVRVLPQAFVLGFLDMIISLARGRVAHAGSVLSSAFWNLGHLPRTLRVRSNIAKSRRVADSEIRKKQIGGSARVTTLMRGVAANQGKFPAALAQAARIPDRLGGESAWAAMTAGIVVSVVLWAGSRSLIGGGVPMIGEFVGFDDPSALFREWWTGWRSIGLGSESAAPTLLGASKLLSWFTFGHLGLARTLLFLGPLPLGALAMWRLASRSMSHGASIAALGAYLVNPVPYNAVAEGRWQALVLYAALPSLFRRIAQAGRWAPFGDANSTLEAVPRQIGGLAALLAVTVMVAPVAYFWVVVIVAVLCGIMMLTGGGGEPVRALTVTGGALLLSLVIHLPWTLSMLGSQRRWAAFFGASPTRSGRLSLTDALSFNTGSIGSIASAGLLLGGIYVLVAGGDVRFRWGAVASSIALVALSTVVLAGRLSLDVAVPPAELLLVPLTLATAFGVGLGFDAFRIDVFGRAFGWRQAVAVVTAAASVLAIFPFLLSLTSGRWDAPEGDLVGALEPLAQRSEDARILWIGDGDVLPVTGWPYSEGVQFALTDGVETNFSDISPYASEAGEEQLKVALELIEGRATANGGAILASFGIHYVVVSERVAPLPYDAIEVAAPDSVLDGLAEQVDLSQVEVAPGVIVYENAIDGFVRSAIPATELNASEFESPMELVSSAPPDRTPVLEHGDVPISYSGDLSGDGDVVVAQNLSDRWTLTADGQETAAVPTYGWASRFQDVGSGSATLSFEAGVGAKAAHLIQLLALLLLPLLVSRRLRPIHEAEHHAEPTPRSRPERDAERPQRRTRSEQGPANSEERARRRRNRPPRPERDDQRDTAARQRRRERPDRSDEEGTP